MPQPESLSVFLLVPIWVGFLYIYYQKIAIMYVPKLYCNFFQNKGKIVLAMDALFGLPRKKSAGLSYRHPLYRDLHFLDQEVVDQYVSDYPKSKALAVVSFVNLILFVLPIKIYM